MGVSVLHFFAVHVNSACLIVKFLQAGQYGVYVLQTIFIPLIMWTWILILGAAGHPLEFSYCTDTPTSSTHMSQGLVIVGWLYVVAVVHLLSWPFAYAFRKLPGVSGVL